ncbi:MAG: metallophosphoesterase [Spirochaetia bacterium]
MSLRVLLTADIHLGMAFAGYADAQAALVEARFQALENVVAEANARRSDLLVVAGDLFEKVTVEAAVVRRAAEILRGFSGRLVAVLPGNHDYLSADDPLWPGFRDAAGDATLLLDQGRPYPLDRHDMNACLYPCPCLSRHSADNAIGWVRETARDRAILHHIGVAHGSLEGLSPDFNGDYYPMTRRQLEEAGLSLWLLGHTHVRFPPAPGRLDRIFNPGTPAPDGFNCTHAGTAWSLELDDHDTVSAEPIVTGSLRFVEETIPVHAAQDLEKLAQRFSGPEAKSIVLKAHLEGRASAEVIASLGALRQRMNDALLYLDLRSNGLREEITRESIDREFPQGSFPHALLLRLAEEGDLEALEAAHQLIAEAQR